MRVISHANDGLRLAIPRMLGAAGEDVDTGGVDPSKKPRV
jgi:hypothetical protein